MRPESPYGVSKKAVIDYLHYYRRVERARVHRARARQRVRPAPGPARRGRRRRDLRGQVPPPRSPGHLRRRFADPRLRLRRRRRRRVRALGRQGRRPGVERRHGHRDIGAAAVRRDGAPRPAPSSRRAINRPARGRSNAARSTRRVPRSTSAGSRGPPSTKVSAAPSSTSRANAAPPCADPKLFCVTSTGLRPVNSRRNEGVSPSRQDPRHVFRGGSSTVRVGCESRRRLRHYERRVDAGSVRRPGRLSRRRTSGVVLYRGVYLNPGTPMTARGRLRRRASRAHRTRRCHTVRGCVLRRPGARSRPPRGHVSALAPNDATGLVVHETTRVRPEDVIRRSTTCRSTARSASRCSWPASTAARTSSRPCLQAMRRKRLITYESTLRMFQMNAAQGVRGTRAMRVALERLGSDASRDRERDGDVASPEF